VNDKLGRLWHGYGSSDAEQDDPSMRWQTFTEDQRSEVVIEGYEESVIAHGASQYVGIHHPAVIFVHPGYVVAGIAQG